MILFEGKLLPDEKQDWVMERLWDSCLKAVENRRDFADEIIFACDQIQKRIRNGNYDSILNPLLAEGKFTREQLMDACRLFEADNLRRKYETEFLRYKEEVESNTQTESRKFVVPQGILFHIAAGNAQGLPFYSVLEGLLVGNVNILKLPSMDDGVSVLILSELIKLAPVLAPYVCVLDLPSTNIKRMKQLGAMADAIVVWGGDEAISAVRSMAEPQTQIISWGHKLSFAYLVPMEDLKKQDALLRELAHHICLTKQVLCSSCQGLFVDIDDTQLLAQVGQRFFEILCEVASEYPPESIGVRGKLTLLSYNQELESAFAPSAQHDKYLADTKRGVCVIIKSDRELELSGMFRNCWVKALPREEIIRTLKPHRNHLQTVGLLTSGKDEDLETRLIGAGVVKLRASGTMSHTFAGETHDGEFALRRYTRIIEKMLDSDVT